MREVAVLFARVRSEYKEIAGCDVYDEKRDARTFPGGLPVVAHPPCRMWGRFHHRAKPEPHERELAIFAVERVREWGGVLEHPAHSKLWIAAQMPRPGEPPDSAGGYTIQVNQCDWGHAALKPTWLYCVGIEQPHQFPEPGTPTKYVEKMCRAERERTPMPFAQWLVDLARQSNRTPP